MRGGVRSTVEPTKLRNMLLYCWNLLPTPAKRTRPASTGRPAPGRRLRRRRRCSGARPSESRHGQENLTVIERKLLRLEKIAVPWHVRRVKRTWRWEAPVSGAVPVQVLEKEESESEMGSVRSCEVLFYRRSLVSSSLSLEHVLDIVLYLVFQSCHWC